MADTDPAAAELDPIREREAAATPAPWGTEEDEDVWKLFGALDAGFHPYQLIKAPKHDPRYAEYWPNDADAAFIVHARTDLPRLLAAVDKVLELARTLDVLADALTEHDQMHPDEPDVVRASLSTKARSYRECARDLRVAVLAGLKGEKTDG